MTNRRVIHQVTLRYLLKNRKRTVISLVSISLLVLLMTCVFIGRDTVISYFTRIAEADKGKWHIACYNIGRQQYGELVSLPFVTEAAPSANEYYSESQIGNSTVYLNLRRYSAAAMDWMNLKVTEGRLPENDHEIVLSESIRSSGEEIAAGSCVDLDCYRRFLTNTGEGMTMFPFQQFLIEAGETKEVPTDIPQTGSDPVLKETREYTGIKGTYTVCGFIEAPSFENPSSSHTVITLMDTVPESGLFNTSLRTDGNPDIIRIREITDGMYEVNNPVMIFSGSSSNSSMNLIVTAVQVFLTLLILIISVILLNNVFALSYDERLKYLGMLTSIGATGRQKRSSVWYEAFLLLAVSLPAGIILGCLLIRLIVSFLGPAASALTQTQLNADVPANLIIRLPSLMLVIAASAVTVLISAFLPARKLSRIGPVESIRGNDTEISDSSRKSRRIHKDGVAMLADGFLKRERKKTAGIVRTLTVFVTVLITVAYTSQAVIQMTAYKLNDVPEYESERMKKYEYCLFSSGSHEIADEIIRNLESTGGIEADEQLITSSTFAEVSADVFSDEFMNAYRDVISQYYPEGLSDEVFQDEYVDNGYFFLNLLAVDDTMFAKMSGTDAKGVKHPVILAENGYFSTDEFGIFGQQAQEYRYCQLKEMTHLKPADTFPVHIADYSADMTVIATMDDRALSEYGIRGKAGLTGITSVSAFQEMLSDIPAGYERMYLFNADSENAELAEMISGLRQMKSDDMIFAECSTASAAALEKTVSSLVHVLMISFAAVSSLICFLSIFNAAAALMNSRRKNYAVLRSLGMENSQMRRMILREWTALSLISIITGAVIAAVLCFAVRVLIISRFGSFTVRVPYVLLGCLIILTMAAMYGIIRLLYTKELRENLIDEIRRESI